jgi:hypothetical protein
MFVLNESSKVPQQILNLFPLEDVITKDSPIEAIPDPTTDRLKRMGESLVWQEPSKERENNPELHRAGNFYRYYRSVDILPEKARGFYSKAGKLKCLLVLFISAD